eukprot:12880880-Prorocentrum_lima.AAC.1
MAVTQRPWELVLYLDGSRYDETPMRVTYAEPLAAFLGSGQPASSQVNTGVGQALGVHPGKGVMTKASAVQKMLSSEHKWAMLLMLPAQEGQDREGDFTA